MYFPVSGVEANPIIPLLAAFVISLLTAPAGVSGAFLLLPFQVSVLGFTSPAVSPTNLIYNIVATPGGIYRYVRERRVVWPLVWTVTLASGIDVERGYYVFGALGALVFAAVTGLAMLLMLRGRIR